MLNVHSINLLEIISYESRASAWINGNNGVIHGKNDEQRTAKLNVVMKWENGDALILNPLAKYGCVRRQLPEL